MQQGIQRDLAYQEASPMFYWGCVQQVDLSVEFLHGRSHQVRPHPPSSSHLGAYCCRGLVLLRVPRGLPHRAAPCHTPRHPNWAASWVLLTDPKNIPNNTLRNTFIINTFVITLNLLSLPNKIQILNSLPQVQFPIIYLELLLVLLTF